LKSILSSPPILDRLEDSEPILLYLAASNKIINIVIMVERKEEGHGIAGRATLDLTTRELAPEGQAGEESHGRGRSAHMPNIDEGGGGALGSARGGRGEISA
jgi:hypothetical protein